MTSPPRDGRDRPDARPGSNPGETAEGRSAEQRDAPRIIPMPGSTSQGEPPEIEIGEIWGRQRVIFLLSSALFVLLVAWFTREVVLPFILAVIIAYVLTPLVAWCERRGLRRAVAIIV